MTEIVEYRPEHQPFWEKLNRDWIKVFFEIEPFDEYVLQNPGEAILKDGGAILIALYNGVLAGTAGLRKLDEQTFEFTKMTVAENFRRKGIGEAMCYASFKKAKELGATSVILYSNKLQAAAINMYEKIGFKQLPVETTVYKRADVKMEINLDEVLNKQLSAIH
jgi:ribosomal protein S18 acetylase RimI-like enzyme